MTVPTYLFKRECHSHQKTTSVVNLCCHYDIVAKAQEEERERCAKLAEEMTMRGEVEETRGHVRRSLIAEAILGK